MTKDTVPGDNSEFNAIWEKVQPFTMTSPERGLALYRATRWVIENDIPGAFVECGVWRGGSSMLIALTLQSMGAERELFMLDTYEGMTEPGEFDLDMNSEHAAALMEGSHGDEVAELVKAEASFEDVQAAILSTGYDPRKIHMVKGDVRKTAATTSTLNIALLRLDTDFYDSTLVELEEFYPRLVPGGVLIIDDYGHWQGSRKAFHDYFDHGSAGYQRPLLWPIDYTGYGGIKSEARTEIEIDRYDYIPPGMSPPSLLDLFPHAAIENPWGVGWPFLRPEVPHLWRSDTRDTTGYKTGNASVEEACCLYELGKQFKGKRGLEIGTHFGWTGAHLLSTGMEMDFIDPEFSDPARQIAVDEVFKEVAQGRTYRTWSGFSPAIVPEVRAAGDGSKWSFVFIDGSHDDDAPANDARGVLEHLADDAVVVFHDLTSPFVEAGLNVMKEAGLSVRLFNTMQILGVAWRGDVTIPDHVADPNVSAIYQPHLEKYRYVSTSERDIKIAPGSIATRATADPAIQSAAPPQPVATRRPGLLKKLIGRKKKSPPTMTEPTPTPAPAPKQPDAPAMDIWENYITLNSDVNPAFKVLDRASAYLATDKRAGDWTDLDYADALARDDAPLPMIEDREGYYGEDHFSYWASGLADARYLMDAARDHDVDLRSYLDLGCASGRVIRHFAFQTPEVETWGCDINRLHVQWCNSHLPDTAAVFQNTSVPSLPLPDASLDAVSAYSVFTHIEAMETAWLMELRRVLRPGGIAWITVHTEHTLADMTEDWPLWNPTMEHPDAATKLDANRNFDSDRLVLRWRADRSYASNVFYKMDYLKKHWSRFFEIAEVRRRFPSFQDVIILKRKP